ncbi:MAG: shikimate dehydrogenase [Thermodesulfobacteriota bacterium]
MINSNTDLYCIFGKPIKHSKSPVIHNAWFEQYKINAAYLAFEIRSISNAVTAMKTFNIQGASVTIPYKESVMDCLDHIDNNALNIGAVNTIVNSDKQLTGFNTDFMAAIEPVKHFGINNKKVCIIGAGGAARAVAYGIRENGGKLVIINRSIEKGKTLALKYDADFISMDEINKKGDFEADIIINTTPLGMYPDIKVTPFPSRLLNQKMIVMDIIYNPLKTRLLSEAQNKGCTTVDGLSMFIHQGAAQFELWTGITPEIKTVQEAILYGHNERRKQ